TPTHHTQLSSSPSTPPFRALVGDSAETLRALLPKLERKRDRSWAEKVAGNVSDWWAVLEKRAAAPADPINPQLVFHELSKRLPVDRKSTRLNSSHLGISYAV